MYYTRNVNKVTICSVVDVLQCQDGTTDGNGWFLEGNGHPTDHHISNR